MSLYLGIVVGIIMFGLTTTVEAGRYFDVNDIGQAPTGTGTIFYVDSLNGNDAWNGRSPTYTTGTTGPFKTISKAIDRYAGRNVGGNTILVKAGTYRERIKIGNVTSATSENSRFVLGSYGDGRVIIDASNTSSLTWTAYSGNNQIYVADFTLTLGGADAVPQAVVMDDKFKSCRPVQSLSLLTSFGKWYYDSASKKIYVYTGGVNPTNRNIIVTKRDQNNLDYGIYITGDYVTIYGLTVVGAGSYGIHGTTGSHTRVQKCDVKYSGKAGIKLYGDYGELLKNRVYGNVLLNWPRGSTWDSSGGWPNGMSGGNFSHISGNIVYDNGGEGIGSMADAGGLIVEDNISHDNWSVNIYLDNQPNDIVRRNLVYNTTLYPEDAMDQNLIPTWTSLNKILKRMFPEGIVTGDETASGTIATSINHKIYDNLIINCYTGYSHYGQATGAGFRNFTIANNTIVLPDFAASFGSFTGINLGYYSASTNTVIKNNIIFGTNHGALVSLGSATDAGIVFDNNLYYDATSAAPFRASGQNLAFAGWKTAIGQDYLGKFANPQFSSKSDVLSADYYVPANTSPAIGMASAISDFYTDFNGVTKAFPWTAGALDSGSVNGDSILPVVTAFTAQTHTNKLTFSVDLTANDDIDGSGLGDHCITINNTPNSCIWSPSAPVSFSVSADGHYTLYPWVRDKAGNVSALFGSPRTIIVDTTSPLVTVFSIPATATSRVVSISSLTATDINGVTGYLVTESSTPPLVDAIGWNPVAPTSFTFSSSGSKTAYAWAKDAVGNLSNGLGRTISITLPDMIAPTVSINAPAFGANVSGTTIVNVAASDNVGISKVELYINGQLAGTKTAAPYTFSWVSGSYPIGSNSLVAYAYDAAGNRAQSAAVQVNVTVQDTVAPVVAVVSPLENARIGYSTTIKASATDNTRVVKMTVYVDGTLKVSVNSSTLSWTINRLRTGKHTIVVRAYDAAGNVGSKTVTVYR